MSNDPGGAPPPATPAAPPAPAPPTPAPQAASPQPSGPDVWASWASSMPDAELPQTMPDGFTAQAGFLGLHAQRKRADQFKAQFAEAQQDAEQARAQLAAAQELAQQQAVESYLHGRGGVASPRAARTLREEWQRDQQGAETPQPFHQWAASESVTKDPYMVNLLSIASGGQAAPAPSSPPATPREPAPTPGARHVAGGPPAPLDISKLKGAQVAAMLESGELTRADYLAATAKMG